MTMIDDSVREHGAASKVGSYLAAVAAPNRHATAMCVHELAAKRFKPRVDLLSGLMATQDLAMVYAPRGIGKTHFGLALGFAVATGGAFLKWKAAQPRKVLYIDGELPGQVFQERILMHMPLKDPDPDYFRAFTPDLMSDDELLPDLATPVGQLQVEAMMQPDTALLVIDNLSALCRGHRGENDAESWVPVADWLLTLRRRGVAVLLVHHSGKGGDQRGTSKREDILDLVLRLARPDDYDATEGARFTVEFAKARHLYGSAAQSLEVIMSIADGSMARWTWQASRQTVADQIAELFSSGTSQAEIAKELGVARSTVSRQVRKIADRG